MGIRDTSGHNFYPSLCRVPLPGHQAPSILKHQPGSHIPPHPFTRTACLGSWQLLAHLLCLGSSWRCTGHLQGWVQMSLRSKATLLELSIWGAAEECGEVFQHHCTLAGLLHSLGYPHGESLLLTRNWEPEEQMEAEANGT